MNCLDGVVERDARPPMLVKEVKEVREVREVKAKCFVAYASKRTIGSNFFNFSKFFNFSIFSEFF